MPSVITQNWRSTTADASLLDLSKYRRKEFNHADKMWKGLPVCRIIITIVLQLVMPLLRPPTEPAGSPRQPCERARRRKSTPLGALRVARHLTWSPRIGLSHRPGPHSLLPSRSSHAASMPSGAPMRGWFACSPTTGGVTLTQFPWGVCHLGQFKLSRPALIVTTGQKTQTGQKKQTNGTAKTTPRQNEKLAFGTEKKQHREQDQKKTLCVRFCVFFSFFFNVVFFLSLFFLLLFLGPQLLHDFF